MLPLGLYRKTVDLADWHSYSIICSFTLQQFFSEMTFVSLPKIHGKISNYLGLNI